MRVGVAGASNPSSVPAPNNPIRNKLVDISEELKSILQDTWCMIPIFARQREGGERGNKLLSYRFKRYAWNVENDEMVPCFAIVNPQTFNFKR